MMTDPAYYELHPRDNERCPKCNSPLHLLMPTTGNHPEFYKPADAYNLPNFSICFKCKFIAQNGVGVVSLVEETSII